MIDDSIVPYLEDNLGVAKQNLKHIFSNPAVPPINRYVFAWNNK
jgi:hypothetical protein